jgi:hypothetical protein
MILGLDISTSTVGATVLNLTGGLECITYVKPIGTTMYEKVQSTFLTLRTRLVPFKITSIYAESPNIMFRAGFSSAQVLSTILKFNGALLFTLHVNFNTLPKEAMAVSMRKQVTGHGRFAKGTDTKQEVLKWVTSEIPWFTWPTIEKGKNKGKPLSECFDMADSYIVARYGLLHESGNAQNQN